MNRYLNILIFVILMSLGVQACTPEALVGSDVVRIPNEGYIHFGTLAPTRAAQSNLVESMTGKDFNVIAYEYPNSTTWDIFKATGKPSTQFNCPTEVAYSDGLWSYAPLVPWESAKKYSFFAYYPTTLQTSTTQSTVGIPSVSFIILRENYNPENLHDVLIASKKNVINDGNGVVSFEFKHALSCMTFEARNFDEVETSADDAEKERKKQYVKGLNVYFTSKMYTRFDIPLDEDMSPTPSVVETGGFHYVINSNSETTEVPALVKGNQIQVYNVSTGNNVLFIPQRVEGVDGISENSDDMGRLTGYVEFYCKDAEGNEAFRTGNPTRQSESVYRSDLFFESDKNFQAGKMYSLVINFTSNAQISIAIIESGDWTDSNQDITFE